MDNSKCKDPNVKHVRRVCASCGARMSSIEYDPHLHCATCIGHQCSLEVRCDGCKDWTAETMSNYLKHQASLKTKRDSKARRKLSSAQDSDTVGGSQASGVSETESLAEGSEYVSKETLNSCVAQLQSNLETRLDSKLSDLSENLAVSLNASMLELFKDLSNSLFSAPRSSTCRTPPKARSLPCGTL